MNKKLFGMAAGLALFVLPALAADRHILNTQVPAESARLPMLSRLPATNRLHLAIGLPFRNQDILTNLLRQLYNPGSTNFHRYLTPDLFAEQFGPTEQDYQRVKDFAESNRLEVVGPLATARCWMFREAWRTLKKHFRFAWDFIGIPLKTGCFSPRMFRHPWMPACR